MLTFNWASAVCRGRTTEFHHVSSILYTSRHSHGSDMGWLGTLFFPVECFSVVGPGLRLCQDPPERSSRRRISRKSALGAGDGQCWLALRVSKCRVFQRLGRFRSWPWQQGWGAIAHWVGSISVFGLSGIAECLGTSLLSLGLLIFFDGSRFFGRESDVIWYIYIYVYIIVILIWRWGANGCDLYCTDYSNVNVQWLMRSFLQDIPCGISSKTYHVAMVIHGYRL